MSAAAEVEDLSVNQASDELLPEEQARADSYRLLAALLAAAPSEDLLGLLRALEAGPGEGGGPESVGAAWAGLRGAAGMADATALEREYWNLFIGLGRGELVPYASVYLTGFLMEKPLADLRTRLNELGFARADEVREPEDHIAALCEVMAELIASDSPLATQKDFFETFIAPWAGRFFGELQQAEGARFYRAVGELGARFVALEQKGFGMPA